MPDTRPNVLVIMTDQERYPPPYEDEAVTRFRREHLPGRERIRAAGTSFARAYAASSACIPSRTSMFTGQYPSLHGVRQTDGLAKPHNDPAMRWLDPDGVPTMGDWFRAAGYQTHYRGKWHISHADLMDQTTHLGIAASDAAGGINERAVEAYRRADRLEPFGFSGWIGREPHGRDPADTGLSRDPIFAAQLTELFGTIRDNRTIDHDARPWLAVASFVNPHDIAFGGLAWQVLGFPDVADHVPFVPASPTADDAFDGRPDCQRRFSELWPELLFPQPADDAHRRLYLYLHLVVDAAIVATLDALEANGLGDDTIVVLTSDHGDLLGAHGGLQQKWYNAYDEAIRVPLTFAGPGIAVRGTDPAAEIGAPTSHIDLLPTLLGLIGADAEALATTVRAHHVETQPLPGRDLTDVLRGTTDETALDRPVYFMTEDRISSGMRTANILTGKEYDHIVGAASVESVIARVARADEPGAPPHLWKLNHYYEAHPDETADPSATDVRWELHDLTVDPAEAVNLALEPSVILDAMQDLLRETREQQARQPQLTNAAIA